MSKFYGVGSYRAQRIAPTFIAIIATGTTPNLPTRVTVEQLPWRIYPPRFALFFEEPAITVPATRPFVEAGFFLYPKDQDVVTVIDAAGSHAVDIVGELALVEMQLAGSSTYAVYQQIGTTTCIVAPDDAILPAIYTRVYGPASEADCTAWAAANCGR
ncbi:MAG: hypothetical protein NW223_07400 [Hyphomicrobiaceae bacterium]|nr:hypothetical protein [Hyphomicrobiaceae bacterium]